VVVVSSSLDAGDLKKAKSCKDVFDFLEKPLDMDKLFKVLNPSS
jgi:DNA-binding NtrC family response regulator